MAREQTSFGLSGIYSAMGVRTPRNIPLETGSAIPVVQLADFANSYAPEQVEARGVAGTSSQGFAGEYWFYELFSRAPGGCVVEAADTNLPTAGSYANAWWYGCVTPTTWLPAPFAVNVVNIGGRGILSTFTKSRALIASPQPTITGLWLPSTEKTDLRIYVPPGSYFFFFYGNPASDQQVGITWREIPELLGAP